jgi:2'-5' RNA ligase
MKTTQNYYEYLKTSGSDYKSFWIGHYIQNDLSEYLIPNGENQEDLHFTICYCGDLDQYSQEQIQLAKMFVANACKLSKPLEGFISGLGRFSATESSDGKDVIYTSVDIPGLEDFRYNLNRGLKACGINSNKEHGFTPHITLAYVDSSEPTPIHRVRIQPLLFNNLTLDCGLKQIFYFGVN